MHIFSSNSLTPSVVGVSGFESSSTETLESTKRSVCESPERSLLEPPERSLLDLPERSLESIVTESTSLSVHTLATSIPIGLHIQQ
ncbi:hypothetical protein Hanom_Chr04g00290891 [Helianthus anomalus]